MRLTEGMKRAIKVVLAKQHGPAKLPCEMLYRGKAYVLVACCGEAHSNPYIDHCALCMPLWGICVEGPL